MGTEVVVVVEVEVDVTVEEVVVGEFGVGVVVVDVVVEEVVFGEISVGIVAEVAVVAEEVCLCVEEDVDVIVADEGVGGDVCSAVSLDSVTIVVSLEEVLGEIDVEREGIPLVVSVAFKEIVRVIVNVEFMTILGASEVVCADVFVGISVEVEFLTGVVKVVFVVVDVRVEGVVGFVTSVGVVSDGVVVVVDVDVVVVLGFLDVVTFEILFVFNVVSDVV